MDNITQGVIGGSLYSLITKKYTRKDFLLGAVIANVPDFDVVVGQILPFSSEISKFFFHRGIMHSVVFGVGTALVIAGILRHFDKKKTTSYRRYALASFVAMLFGHLLIDGMTSYGMRYWLPRSGKTYSTDNIFVVDLGVWAIILSGFIAYMSSKTKVLRKTLALWILVVSAGYFILSGVFQAQADDVFHQSYNDAMVSGKTIVEPFQILLWKHIAHTKDGYRIGYYSLLDSDKNIERIPYPEEKQERDEALKIIQENNLSRDRIRIHEFARGNIRIIKEGDSYRLQNMISGPMLGRNHSLKLEGGMDFELRAQDDKTRKLLISKKMNTERVSRNTWRVFWERVRGEK